MVYQNITLKVGLYAHNFLSNGSRNPDGAQSLAGFMLAMDEINNNKTFLPSVRFVVALRGDDGSYGAITSAQSFLAANFTIDRRGRKIPANTFVRGDPIGVDIILGAGNDVETEQINQVLNYFKIVQVHTVATSTNLAIGSNYPYKVQISPIISFDGQIIQNIFCSSSGIRRVAIISTDDFDGLKSVEELTDNTHCPIQALSTQIFPVGIQDFSSLIAEVKASGAVIFVIFMPVQSAALFLEQAYEQGLLVEGTLVFANSLANSNSLWSYFVNPSNTKSIMRGYFGLENSPTFSLHSTKVGRSFVSRFSNQKNTVTVRTDGSTVCDNMTDDTGRYLYQRLAHVGTPAACAGLQFSSYLARDSPMYAYTPHAYDAMYALARGVEQVFDSGGKNSLTGDSLHDALLHNVSFQGATGDIRFTLGRKENQDYSMGDREVGFTYLLYNFNDDLFDSTGGTTGLARVGEWALESGGLTLCSNKTASYDTIPCTDSITYRTANNRLPSDTQPDILAVISPAVAMVLILVGSCACLLVVISLALVVRYRASKLIKASQPPMLYIIHLGCLFSAVRTIVGGLPMNTERCTAEFWFGHLAFGFIFSAMLVKTWRVDRLINTKSIQRIKITGTQVTVITMSLMCGLCVYLIISTLAGQPRVSTVRTLVANQTTCNFMCTFLHTEFSTALFACEAAAVLYGAYLCHVTRNAPDAINDTYHIACGERIFLPLNALFLSSFHLLPSPDPQSSHLLPNVHYCSLMSTTAL